MNPIRLLQLLLFSCAVCFGQSKLEIKIAVKGFEEKTVFLRTDSTTKDTAIVLFNSKNSVVVTNRKENIVFTWVKGKRAFYMDYPKRWLDDNSLAIQFYCTHKLFSGKENWFTTQSGSHGLSGNLFKLPYSHLSPRHNQKNNFLASPASLPV